MAIIRPAKARSDPRRPRRDGRAENAVIVAGMVAIIAIAIGAGVYSWRNPENDAVRRERADRPMFFQCERCGYKFSMPPRDFHAQWRDVNPGLLPEGSRFKAHCPRCGAKYCAKMLDNRLSDEERRRVVSTRPAPPPTQP